MIRKIIFLFLCASLFADVRTIESFQEVVSEFKELDETTLVVFDIDEVLITAVDQGLKTPHKKLFRKIADEFMENAKTKEQKKLIEYRLSLTYLYPDRVVTEPEVIGLLKKLQEQGVYVMGITRCHNGRYGIIPHVEQWRKEILWKNGINFNKGQFHGVSFELDGLGYPEGGAPQFDKGLLFGKKYPKARLIREVIDQLQLPVKTIYVIDDEQNNLAQLHPLDDFNVHPIEYIGAKKQLKELSKRKLRWQITKLVETGEWIDDQTIDEFGMVSGFFKYSIPSWFF